MVCTHMLGVLQADRSKHVPGSALVLFELTRNICARSRLSNFLGRNSKVTLDHRGAALPAVHYAMSKRGYGHVEILTITCIRLSLDHDMRAHGIATLQGKRRIERENKRKYMNHTSFVILYLQIVSDTSRSVKSFSENPTHV
jgi:hypothetical protein